MAFFIPEFPIVCNIFDFVLPLPSPRLEDVPCNLAVGKRVQQAGRDFGGGGTLGLCPVLLLGKDVDIRDASIGGYGDIVEVPAGSSRWYQVSCCEFFGLGFDNQHKGAALVKASANLDNAAYPGLFWPIPDVWPQ
jgi:hypothetical protein